MTTVIGIAGSLRRGSYNHSLLRAARELAPEGMELRIFERMAEIPLFNEDVEAQGGVVVRGPAVCEAVCRDELP